jgi:hypothetical protein
MQQSKQPFWARLQLFAGLTLNAGKHTGSQPARVAQLDDGNDRAILVQGDEGSAQVIQLGHRGTPSRKCSDEVAISSAARPIASFVSAMRWHRRQRGRGVTRLIRVVSGGSSDRPPQLDWYTGTMPVAIL